KTLPIYSKHDTLSYHPYKPHHSYLLPQRKKPIHPYLHIEPIIHIPKTNHLHPIHPAYAFFSQNIQFPKPCEEEAIIFI
uniref:biotin carboxylase N-terminal domain-containing protein n=1 Tax=Bacillus thuringiensis TaxID=1428 RepID=UPI0011A4486C